MVQCEQEYPELPRELVDNPPPEGSFGREFDVACFKGCDWRGFLRAECYSDPIGKCPECDGVLEVDITRSRAHITSKGAGFHSTAFGQRRKDDMTRRNEKLRKSQWDNHEPVDMQGKSPRNPTANGPYDPSGPFAKKKGPVITSIPKKKGK